MKYTLRIKVETLHPVSKKGLRELVKALEKKRGIVKVAVLYIEEV